MSEYETSGSEDYDDTKERLELSRHRLEVALEPTNLNLGLEEYLDLAGIAIADLKGDVLDLGAGDHERFSREAGQHGINVVSLNPFLVRPIDRLQVKTGQHYEFPWTAPPETWQGQSVAGLAQELPFKEESFDTVVSCLAVPGYIETQDYETILSEMNRVLKPGGVAYLFPLFEIPSAPYDEKEFVRMLEELGQDYEMNEVANPNIRVQYKVAMIRKDTR